MTRCLETEPKIHSHLERIAPLGKGVGCAGGSTLYGKRVVTSVRQVAHPQVDVQTPKSASA